MQYAAFIVSYAQDWAISSEITSLARTGIPIRLETLPSKPDRDGLSIDFGEAGWLLIKEHTGVSSSQALESNEVIWKIIDPLKFIDYDGNDPLLNGWSKVREDHLLFSPNTFAIIFNQDVGRPLSAMSW